MILPLFSILPAPSAVTDEYSSIRRDPWFQGRDAGFSKAIVSKEPPPYMKRNNWRPSNPEVRRYFARKVRKKPLHLHSTELK